MTRPRIHLRLPAGLDAELRERAEQEEVSLNTLLATLLAGSIGWEQPKEGVPSWLPEEVDE